jgi:prepilin-type processing-associated H-X9-DG protein
LTNIRVLHSLNRQQLTRRTASKGSFQPDTNYAFADGHVQLLNANEIRCDKGECWWSINLLYHQTQQP